MSDELYRPPLQYTPPPEGQEITVSMRCLWLALNGFGFPDPDPAESDAFEALWSQITAERSDNPGDTDPPLASALHWECDICKRVIPVEGPDAPAAQMRRHLEDVHPTAARIRDTFPDGI